MKWFSKLNLPNKITVIRIFIVLLVIVFGLTNFTNIPLFNIGNASYSLKRIILLFLFVVGSISDYLDGHIARKNNIVTTFGKFLDPIADKLLVNVLYIILAMWAEVPLLVVIIFIVRDTVVDAIRLIAMDRHVVIAASKWGKAKTVTQMVVMILVLIQIPFMYYISYIAAAVSLISGIDYFIKNKKLVLEGSDYNGK